MTDPTPNHDPNDAHAVLDDSRAAVVTADHPKRRRGLPDPFGLRALILVWCMWLLVSWSITLTIGATAHAVRWVVFSAALGMMGVWPAFRLGQDPIGGLAGYGPGESGHVRPGLRVLATWLDWLCLVLVFQVVVWPLMLVGHWSWDQTLLLDAAVASWSLLTAVLVGLGRVLPVSGARFGAMLLCMLLLVGEPAAVSFLGQGFDPVGASGWQMRISPIQALWELTTTIRPYDPWVWWPVILSTATAGVLGWALLWGLARLNRCSQP